MDFLCEHVVERKKEGLYRFKKSGIISAIILLPIILIVACMALSTTSDQLIFLRWSLFLIPLFVWLGAKFGPIFAAYGDEAYEYSIVSGEMEFAKIYGDRFRREWVSFKLNKLEACKPLDRNYNSLDLEHFDAVYRAVSSMDAPHIYYAIFRDERDNRCLIYFEAVKKSLRMIKTYYPQTVMTVIED